MMAPMPAKPTHTGDQIRTAREIRGWTQAQLAEHEEVTARTVRNWEQTGAVPKRKLTGIDDALRLTGTGTIFRPDYRELVNAARDAAEQATGQTRRAAEAYEQHKRAPMIERLLAMRAELDDIIITELGGRP